jgi:alpha 1,6-mannosyltransferase
MRLPLPHPAVKRLLGAVSILAVCYFVLRLQGPAWNSRPVLTPAPVATTPSPQAPIAIPQKLWYKLGPNGLNDELRRYTDSCITKNPTFETKFVTDGSGDEFVKQYLTSRPDIADNFLAISIPIVKADLFRYLILYEHGGIWNDLDVSCEAPISDWVPEQYKANASIVVGLEFDVDIWVRQFASWTIMARPKSPHLMTVVEDCIEGLLNKAKEHNVGIQDLKLDMIDDIVDVSGPRRLTRGIQKSLSKMLSKEVGNDDISHVLEPRLIGDVLVLPDYAFANSMNQQHGDKKQGQVLVTHHYAGTWKNAKGGEEPITRIE